MRILPENTQLGKLSIVEIYEFYNIPALFLCKDRDNKYYIATWISENDNCNIWVYASVSKCILEEIRNGNIDLCEIFTGDKKDKVYIVTVYNNEFLEDSVISVGLIDSDMSPLPGYRIDLTLLY